VANEISDPSRIVAGVGLKQNLQTKERKKESKERRTGVIRLGLVAEISRWQEESGLDSLPQVSADGRRESGLDLLPILWSP
jgi:hypothetical protein